MSYIQSNQIQETTSLQIIIQELWNALQRTQPVQQKKIDFSDVPLIQSSETQIQDDQQVVLSVYHVKEILKLLQSKEYQNPINKKFEEKEIQCKPSLLSKYDQLEIEDLSQDQLEIEIKQTNEKLKKYNKKIALEEERKLFLETNIWNLKEN